MLQKKLQKMLADKPYYYSIIKYDLKTDKQKLRKGSPRHLCHMKQGQKYLKN